MSSLDYVLKLFCGWSNRLVRIGTKSCREVVDSILALIRLSAASIAISRRSMYCNLFSSNLRLGTCRFYVGGTRTEATKQSEPII